MGCFIMAEFIDNANLNLDKSMRENVLHRLRSDIFKRKLKPGDRLVETTIAKELGVSRTPVREALRQLESEGLAINIPRRGTIVKGICYQDASDMYDIREVLEGLAARASCLNITRKQILRLYEICNEMEILIDTDVDDDSKYLRLHDEFNKIILEASNNKRLKIQVEAIHEYLKSLRLVSLIKKSSRIRALKEHRTIIAAIESGDEETAEAVTKRHVREAKRSFEESCKIEE